ncbi:MAG: CinA family nicotinamide mononucleotide deamidase-related protein [Chloroflexota bacterium]|nr:CinA family nicotinamide mononucleotide deamidase-related protein [Chloroflexota bacterium]
MPSAEIITIGTEILLGEILDTNSRTIACNFRDVGIDIYRKTTVGDNAQRIAREIRQSMERCDIVITTGGLGPTVDDPTREAVALAMGVELEFRVDLWAQIRARFRRFNRIPTENNRRQAYVPEGAITVENPVGTAPAFIIEQSRRSIIALPGVPREMEHLLQSAVMPYLRERYQLGELIKIRVLHTAGAGESQIDALIDDLERFSNPTVGLVAHSGQVDVRITAKGDSEQDADDLIQPVERVLRERLGAWVYGADQDTLEAVALANLHLKGWKLVVVEAGLGGEFVRRLAAVDDGFIGGEVFPVLPTLEELISFTDNFHQLRKADVSLGVAIFPGADNQDVCFIINTPEEQKNISRPYGSPPTYAPHWALNHGLDLIRNL